MLSKEEYLANKALEEARKAGQAEPEIDAATGAAINPHIPQYISKAPWYLNDGAPSLKHQRINQQVQPDDTDQRLQWYKRGPAAGARKSAAAPVVVAQYRDGACANCGSTTHKTKECVERPRRRGARATGVSVVQTDGSEQQSQPQLDYDGKRDRWGGYDADEYKQVYDKFARIEEQRQKIKNQELNEKLLRKEQEKKAKAAAAAAAAAAAGADGTQADGAEESDSDLDSSDEDEDKAVEGEGVTAVANTTDKRMHSVKNLRIREDKAKYLLNLDSNSAYYDPKTRSMRENPLPFDEDQTFKGDNVLRHTGEYARFLELQKFAMDAGERGQDVHAIALPSQAELLYKQHKQKKEAIKQKQRDLIMQTYGGDEHLAADESLDDIGGVQSEQYVEYSRSGSIVSVGPHRLGRDMVDHERRTSEAEADGTGEHAAGASSATAAPQDDARARQERARQELMHELMLRKQQEAEEAIAAAKAAASAEKSAERTRDGGERDASSKKDKKKKKKHRRHKRSRHSSSSESDSDSDGSGSDRESRRDRRRSKAFATAPAAAAQPADGDNDATAQQPSRKRGKYSSQSDMSYDITEQEMEDYRRTRGAWEDPMNQFAGDADRGTK